MSGSSTISAESATTDVKYRNGVFVPKRVEIDQGQKIRFVNESDKRLWPASNIHPTHEIYPSFDAGRPIEPGETWVFTFEKAGFWRYHNHFAPGESGLVVVRGQSALAKSLPQPVDPKEISFKELGSVSPQDAINLFLDDSLLARFVREYGPASTVRVLAENAIQVKVDCHERAHITGRLAYEAFGGLAFSLSGHDCHSGAFHGATEAFFRDRGTTKPPLRCDRSLRRLPQRLLPTPVRSRCRPRAHGLDQL